MPKTTTEPTPGRWCRVWERGDEFLDHWQGVDWYHAPIPREGHSCLPQTRAVVRVQGLPLMRITRCACGAVNLHDDKGWTERNSRSVPVVQRRGHGPEYLPQRLPSTP